MLRASITKNPPLQAAGLLLWFALVFAPGAWAGSTPAAVAVQYRLSTEFSGPEKSGGRIFISLTNRSSQALSKVTVRLADPTVGKLTGPVQETVQLAPGETRQLEGEFVLNTRVVNSAEPLQWIVVASEADGFAQQAVVRGEVAQAASMDADARTSRR